MSITLRPDDTVAARLLGMSCSVWLEKLRGNRIWGSAVFLCIAVYFNVALTLLFLKLYVHSSSASASLSESESLSTAMHALRIIMSVSVAPAVWHNVQAALRWRAVLCSLLLRRFDVIFLLLQLLGFMASWLYLFRGDATLQIFGLYLSLSLGNVAFGCVTCYLMASSGVS